MPPTTRYDGHVRALAIVVTLAACGGSSPATDAGDDGGPPPPCAHDSLALAVATLAGCSEAGFADGAREDVRFSNPTNTALAPDGAIYVADFDNSRIRVLDATGSATTLVMRPDFAHPFGLAVDGATLYVETDDNDRGEHSVQSGTIWKIDRASGDAAVVARDLGRPRGLAVLPDGKLALADHMHHVVSVLDPTTGVATPLAGALDVPGDVDATGADARFAQPYDVVLLADGDLAVSELDNHRIRRVTLAGVVTGFAGSGTAGTIDGPTAIAQFQAPQGLAVAPDGTLYVTDIGSHFVRAIAGDMVSTVVGDGTAGFLDSDDPRGARLFGLEGIDADATRVVIADGNGGNGAPFHRVRLVQR